MSEPFDVDALPPTQYLVLEVLAARYRLGEQVWPFPSRIRGTVKALVAAGLVHDLNGNVEGTIRARLTTAGREAALDPDYVPPNTNRTTEERLVMNRPPRFIHPAVSKMKKLRKAAGYSLAMMEKEHGINPIVMGSYERGDRMPTVNRLEQILNCFGYTLAAQAVCQDAVRLPEDIVMLLRHIADQLEGANALSSVSKDVSQAA